jgi:uncharacterized membrane protein
MTVFEAVEAELKDLKATGALAATALKMAEELDKSRNGGTSKALINKELRETLAVLRSLAPPAEVEDELSRIRDARSKRHAGGAAASDSARP